MIMKRLLFILFLVPVIAGAQRPLDMPFKYRFADDVYHTALTASLPLKLDAAKKVTAAKILIGEADTTVGVGLIGWPRYLKLRDSLGALITAGSGMANPMTTTADMIYSSSGSTPARLGIGSNGQILTVISGVPAWATPSGTPSSGSFTPTITNVANITSTTGARGFYTRTINVVDVTITVNITPTAGTTITSFTISLPVSSNFITGLEGAGSGGADGTDISHLNLDTANDVMAASFTSIGTSGTWYTAHFKYTVQ
jgi:hypothetical protein